MSEKAKGQNDRAWEALFEKYDILSHIRQEGKFEIFWRRMGFYLPFPDGWVPDSLIFIFKTV